ncbi:MULTISPECIES: undecaprenyldiphospho-muramoylpentapeptide beta-N-acetylglucosaminyltransferase [Auritidibacter]|uniref:undecaprenyldiphospho-muramoylpentapeptide beta-N-acetylglucosaminyltransferase n=1 Tax=Auritidibacter TaxID=1160973 RepID=UPI000D73E61F|nr:MULTISPECIES: undecaprenyldiphospho-muramoylpentapeptide beta-N-acetylglucosaminyltransferase [Auritidibacter]AXR73706.1 undecaprenyldiphospho-muramoylpentapeptide beta-N-acetylglucosaminyltransferase [Auritidibacter sp. NML130574]NIH70371.1 UDP-N-acetylglucosamine--N-acetylmuramyl-(pentapeptide) pyrophosphoryl-undecaprenol N-acetylglucosamine transferase [Auritidibacter ignavus]PXA81370.1 undecaprenyldiphospho-muramoylpentapeptide beta-N-acetylglucosaminyltransferase [Auritidibacter sp. NML1
MSPRSGTTSTASTATPPVLRVVLAGGGTAGHVSPMIQIARAIQRAHPQAEITMVGTREGLEADLVPAAGFRLVTIPKVPMPRTVNKDLFSMPFRLRAAIKASREILRDRRAQVVVGVGGYAATPVYLAAQRERIPVVVHEGNIRPGLANKVGARRAAAVATAFEGTPLPGARHVGMPLRREITTLDTSVAAQRRARQSLGLDPDRTTVVVTGGSSGAQHLNETIAASREAMTATGAQILHLTGKGKTILDENGAPIRQDGYRQVEYIDGLETVFQAADLVVARSGAGTVCELAAVGKPAVLVPLPIGNGEQRLNGAGLVDAGAAVMVDDQDFTDEWVRTHLPALLNDPQRLATMAEAAAAQGVTDADEVMAQIVTEVVTQHAGD